MALFGEFNKTSPRVGRNNTSIKYHDSRHSYLHTVIAGDNCVVGSPDKGTLSPGPGAYTGNIIQEQEKKVGGQPMCYRSSRRLSSPSFKNTVIVGDVIARSSKRSQKFPGPGSYIDIYDKNSPWNKKSFNTYINGKNSAVNQTKSSSSTSNLHRAKSAPSLHNEKKNISLHNEKKSNVDTKKAGSTSASSYYLQLQEEQKKLQERQRKYYETYYSPKEPPTMASSSITTPPNLGIKLEAEGGNDDTFTTESIYGPKSPAPVKESNSPKTQSRFGKRTLKSRTINLYR